MQDVALIAKETPTSAAIFKLLSKRERHRGVQDLRRLYNEMLAQGTKVNQDEFMATFKRLDKAGIGSLIIGRGRNPSRFKWNYNLRILAENALKGKGLDEVPITNKRSLAAKARYEKDMAELSQQPTDVSTAYVNQEPESVSNAPESSPVSEGQLPVAKVEASPDVTVVPHGVARTQLRLTITIDPNKISDTDLNAFLSIAREFQVKDLD